MTSGVLSYPEIHSHTMTLPPPKGRPHECNKPPFVILYRGFTRCLLPAVNTQYRLSSVKTTPASHEIANVVQSGPISISENDCALFIVLYGVCKPYCMSPELPRLATVYRLILWHPMTSLSGRDSVDARYASTGPRGALSLDLSDVFLVCL